MNPVSGVGLYDGLPGLRRAQGNGVGGAVDFLVVSRQSIATKNAAARRRELIPLQFLRRMGGRGVEERYGISFQGVLNVVDLLLIDATMLEDRLKLAPGRHNRRASFRVGVVGRKGCVVRVAKGRRGIMGELGLFSTLPTDFGGLCGLHALLTNRLIRLRRKVLVALILDEIRPFQVPGALEGVDGALRIPGG